LKHNVIIWKTCKQEEVILKGIKIQVNQKCVWNGQLKVDVVQ
jgi:hypothetical protein